MTEKNTEEYIRKRKKHTKNRPPLYNKGKRRIFIKMLLTCGVISQKGICMYDDSPYVGSRKLQDMVKEGVIREINIDGIKNKLKAYVFNKFDETNHIYIDQFDSRLYGHYIRYAKDNGYYMSHKGRETRTYNQGLIHSIMYGAGIKTLADDKPILNDDDLIHIENGTAYYYSSTELKALGNNRSLMDGVSYKATTIKDDKNNVIAQSSSRALGAMFCSDGVYIVYNSGKTHMLWTRRVERQFYLYCQRIGFKRFSGISRNDVSTKKMVVFYELDRIGKQIMLGQRQNGLSYDSGFTETYLIPYTKEGRDLLHLISNGMFTKRIANILLPKSETNTTKRSVPCDAYMGAKNYLLFTSPNITKLQKFMDVAEMAKDPENYVIICFDFQESLLKNIINDNVDVYKVPFDQCKKMLSKNI